MSNISAITVREVRELDPRVARSTHALGRALIELIQERAFDDITVQNILDRAGVGRATFYAHYRNKEDVLHSSYERLFLSLEPLLDRPSPLGPRVFPVTEFLAHVGDVRPVIEGLQGSGRMNDLWSLCVDYAARIIEPRLGEARSRGADVPRALAARMLAGALVETLRWWVDHPDSATPERVDSAFHELVRRIGGHALRRRAPG